MNIANLISGQISVLTLILFVFGIVFIVVLLFFAVFFPNPSPFQFQVFIVVLALAAAGIGAALPGTLDITFGSPVAVSAGGAIALFALVLFFRPVLKEAVVQYVDPKEPPDSAALEFLHAVDAADMAKAWGLLDQEAKGIVVSDFNQFELTFRNAREPFGKALERKLIGTSGARSPAGAPIGLYKSLSYRTKFESSEGERMEVITLRATSDLKWNVFSYLVSQEKIESAK